MSCANLRFAQPASLHAPGGGTASAVHAAVAHNTVRAHTTELASSHQVAHSTNMNTATADASFCTRRAKRK